jgi:hypothetical protein
MQGTSEPNNARGHKVLLPFCVLIIKTKGAMDVQGARFKTLPQA